MSYTLLERTKPKARKAHKCIWCGEMISRGEQYIYEKSIYCGETQSHKWHNECKAEAQNYLEMEESSNLIQVPRELLERLQQNTIDLCDERWHWEDEIRLGRKGVFQKYKDDINEAMKLLE